METLNKAKVKFTWKYSLNETFLQHIVFEHATNFREYTSEIRKTLAKPVRDVFNPYRNENYPYSATVSLDIFFFKGGKYESGTGFMSDSRHMVTKASLIYKDNKMADKIYASPGRNQWNFPYGVHLITQAYIIDKEIAILCFDYEIGLNTGWIPLKDISLEDNFKEKFEITGYNNPKYFERKKKIIAQSLVRDSGDIKLNLENGSILCSIDTTEGQIGSPIWTVFEDRIIAVGLFTHYISENLSQGIMFTTEKIKLISEKICKRELETIYVPKFDLNAFQNKIISGKDHLHLIILGDQNVGKSFLVNRYVKNDLSSHPGKTLGVDFMKKQIRVYNQDYKVTFIDTSGAKQFRSLIYCQYKLANGIALLFDLINRETFENMPKWLNSIKEYASPESIVFIVGNKSDELKKRDVSYEEAWSFASSKGIAYFETSAMNSTGVSYMFESMCEYIVDQNLFLEIKEEDSQLKSK